MTPPSITITRLDLRLAADLDAMTPLFDAYRVFYRQASAPEAGRAFLQARAERGEAVVYLARDAASGEPLGYTQLYPSFSSVSLRPIVILNDLFVAEHARCRGVGTALMDAAVAHAQQHGAVRLTLTTAVTNHTAQSVYQAHGWQRDEVYFTYHRSPVAPVSATVESTPTAAP
jgi:GNAT superfamily N-acetyltransferase